MTTAVYLDGQFTTAANATVSLLDRAYLFGDSVFETVRTYAGVPLRLPSHLDRFFHSGAILGIPLAQSHAELTELVGETVRRTGLDEAYVRITLSRGEGGRGLSPVGCEKPVLSIISRPLFPYPAAAYRDGIRSMTVATRRVPAACLDPSIKCGNYLPSIMARRELDAAGLIEGVQLSIDGCVVCGTVSNVFMVRGGRLLTPDLASGCLPGITRGAVLGLGGELRIECREQRLYPADLAAADEMFFTNTLMECLPVTELDGRRLGAAPGVVTQRIMGAWREMVAKETTGDGHRGAAVVGPPLAEKVKPSLARRASVATGGSHE